MALQIRNLIIELPEEIWAFYDDNLGEKVWGVGNDFGLEKVVGAMIVSNAMDQMPVDQFKAIIENEEIMSSLNELFPLPEDG